MRRFGWLKGFIFLVVFFVPFFLTSCGGGGGGNSNTSNANANGNNGGNTLQAGNSQAALGPLSGAIIKAYKIDNLTTPIEVTTATKSNDIKTAGTFTLNLKGVPDNEWILVTASKGDDIDPYDNGTTASTRVQNKGTIHALAKASDWRKGGNINILTELVWQEIEPELKTDNSTTIENQLNLLASQLLSGDINGDGKINYQDLIAFNPENKKEHYKLGFRFSDIMEKDKNRHSLIDYIHNNEADQEKNRISSLFGDKLGLPTVHLKMISVKPTIILPDNSTISSSSLKVSSFFSSSPEIEDTNKATILMADDSKGDTVLLGYALPSTYTRATAKRLLGMGSSEFTRLASGSTGNNPELSPKSTALALVMMIAGGNSLTTNERTAIINYVLNSSNFDKLVSDISNAIAADPTFLHNINTPKYSSIVTEIKTITKNAISNYIDTIKNERLASYIFYNTMMTRSVRDITPIQPTEIDSFWSTPIIHSPHSPWYPDQPWYWYGSANYTNVTAPPFLAVDKYNSELFALANPDNIYYAALFYNKSGKLVNWYFTKRSRTMIEKAVNSGAAQRTIYYGDKINNSITHIQFNKDWFSGGWSWSDGALPVRLVHFLDLSISVIDVIADAGPLTKVISGFTKHTEDVQAALKTSGCIASITDIMSLGNNNAKDFLADAVLPALKAVPECGEPIIKKIFGKGIKGAINSLIEKIVPKIAAKVSNPYGWAMLVASAADNLVPFGTSLLFAPSTVGYDISWNGNTITSVLRDDNWESSNSYTHTVSGTVSGLANGETVVLLAKLNNSSNTTPTTIPIVTNGKQDFITNVSNGSSYTITIAQDPNGQTCTVTNGSGTVSGTDVTDVTITCTTTTTADTTPPSTPTGLTAKAVSPTQINLSWNVSTDNVGVVGYKIYRNSNFDKTSSTTSASDTRLSPSTKYCYTVTAYDAAGNESAKSNQVCVETPSQTDFTTKPTVIITDTQNGVATTTNPITFTFTWNKPVTGFDSSDIIVHGGTKGAFTVISKSIYKLIITPNNNSTTPITIYIPANSVTDFFQNSNNAIQYIQQVNTVKTYRIADYWPLNYTATMRDCDYIYTYTCFGNHILTVKNGKVTNFGLFVPTSNGSYSLQNGELYYRNIKIIPAIFKIGDVFSYTGHYDTDSDPDGFSYLKITVAKHYDQITFSQSYGKVRSTFYDVIRFDCSVGRGGYPGVSTSIYVARSKGVVARIDHDYISGQNMIRIKDGN